MKNETRFATLDWRASGLDPWSWLSEEWMLICAGRPGDWNAMTASWGGFGHLWNTDVAYAFVRPTRHTFGFMERSEGFTLSFLAPGHRKALEICGKMSGRDGDKAAAAGLTPRTFSPRPGAPERVSFEESRLILSCRKMHAQDLDPSGFIDPSIASHYAARDYHRLYVGAIEGAWSRET